MITGVYASKLHAEADQLHQRVYDRYALSSTDECVCVGQGILNTGRLSVKGLEPNREVQRV